MIKLDMVYSLYIGIQKVFKIVAICDYARAGSKVMQPMMLNDN